MYSVLLFSYVYYDTTAVKLVANSLLVVCLFLLILHIAQQNVLITAINNNKKLPM